MALLLKWQYLVTAGRDRRTLPPNIFFKAANRQDLEITAMILKCEIYLFLNRLKNFYLGNLIGVIEYDIAMFEPTHLQGNAMPTLW